MRLYRSHVCHSLLENPLLCDVLRIICNFLSNMLINKTERSDSLGTAAVVHDCLKQNPAHSRLAERERTGGESTFASQYKTRIFGI